MKALLVKIAEKLGFLEIKPLKVIDFSKAVGKLSKKERKILESLKL